MPKKRHQTKYSKPQSTAPSALTRRGSTSQQKEAQGRTVNQLLADLRRVNLGRPIDVLQVNAPSVPPSIRQILRLPDPPEPAPRPSARRLGPGGRLLPPGPAPPRSWLSQYRQAAPARTALETVPLPPRDESYWESCHVLPGTYAPGRRSLMDLVLRTMAREWDLHKDYGRSYLPLMPDHIRIALITYLGRYRNEGVSLAELQAILLPPPPPPPPASDDDDDDDGDGDDENPPAPSYPSPSTLNEGVTYLDLTDCIAQSVRLRELTDLLFPPSIAATSNVDLQDSWDAAPLPAASIPRPLLPSLTRLSLAIRPGRPSSALPSWKHLLTLADRLPTLTHLSLAYWPTPSLTPNARFASVVGPQGRAIPYGGTTAYSHSLDDDWSEAILILRKLGKKLYGLEHLDLTGCNAWFAALVERSDHDEVDWVGDWGKMTTLVLQPGIVDLFGLREQGIKLTKPEVVERHVRRQRAGRGRMFSVEGVEKVV